MFSSLIFILNCVSSNPALVTNLGIENLPFELQRNFTLMRELDQRTQGRLSTMLNFIYLALFIIILSQTAVPVISLV